MYKNLIFHSLFFLLIFSVVLSPAFAEIEFESGPLEQKPLDEREQESLQARIDLFLKFGKYPSLG